MVSADAVAYLTVVSMVPSSETGFAWEQPCHAVLQQSCSAPKAASAANGVQYFRVLGWTSRGDANFPYSTEKAPLSRLSNPGAWLHCPPICTEYL